MDAKKSWEEEKKKQKLKHKELDPLFNFNAAPSQKGGEWYGYDDVNTIICHNLYVFMRINTKCVVVVIKKGLMDENNVKGLSNK